MASGFRFHNTDLDSVFAPRYSGWPQAGSTDFEIAGYGDINQRYAVLAAGSSAANTDFRNSSLADLATIFAAYGTTNVQVGTQPSNVSGSAAAGYPSGTVTSGSTTCAGAKGSGTYTYAWHTSGCTAISPSSATTDFSAVVSASSTTNASAYCTISDGVTSVNTSTISVPLTNTSPKSQNFSITTATWTNTGGTHIGYNATGGYGSATNTTLPDGTVINALVDNSAGNTSFNISGFSANPGQSYFSSIVADGQTRTSSASTFAYSAGLATWTWPGSTIGFVTGTTYPCTINF